jgi:hypothetical protein
MGAWQPLTFRGVAAFAAASFGRVITVHVVAALVMAGTATWFVTQAWTPVLNEAVEQLPDSGEVRNGELLWTATTPQRLAENRFLAVAVDAADSGQVNRIADAQLEIGRRAVRIAWLGGRLEVNYTPGYRIKLDRAAVVPFWGAWQPFLLAGLASSVVIVLPVLWWLLAAVYTVPAWLLALAWQRELGGGGAWRLAGAAHVPGAAVVGLALLLYGTQFIDLIRAGLLFLVHVPVSWLYLVMAIRRLPPRPPAAGEAGRSGSALRSSVPNPFAGGSAAPPAGGVPARNPFAGPPDAAGKG